MAQSAPLRIELDLLDCDDANREIQRLASERVIQIQHDPIGADFVNAHTALIAFVILRH
ncbi:MAG: hypothetical protein NTZ61_19905 [Proteobacteria bacterium]|nr:hypothetical protein [Pseudomonadota bacterium]